MLQSTAKELYLLTDGDLKKLGSIAKINPHKKEWNAMRLYMQSQAGAECTSYVSLCKGPLAQLVSGQ